MPRLFLLDPVSDAAVGEAMESILPQIVSLLGISEGLGGIGIEGLEVRRGCGRCYHDPGRKRVVADVDNMLAVGRTEDIVKGFEERGVPVTQEEAVMIQRMVQGYVFIHELIHGVVRAKSNTLAEGVDQQAVTGVDDMSEWFAEDLVTDIVNKLVPSGEWLYAFMAVCRNMDTMRPIFGLGKEDEYAGQIERGRRLLAGYGSYERTFAALFESGIKTLDISAGYLEPVNPEDFAHICDIIQREVAAGGYPEAEMIWMIITSAYGEEGLREGQRIFWCLYALKGLKSPENREKV